MFLEIVEGRRVEFSLTLQRKVLIQLYRVGFHLGGGLHGFGRRENDLIFDEELVEILAGVSSLEVGDALREGFLLTVGFMDGLSVLLLKEDAHALRIVHS